MKKLLNLFGSEEKNKKKSLAKGQINEQGKGKVVQTTDSESVFTTAAGMREGKSSQLIPINNIETTESVFDNISFLIYCPKHSKVVICKTEHKNQLTALWLPFISLPPKTCWSEAAIDGVYWILSDNQALPLVSLKMNDSIPFTQQIVEVFRLQLPQKQQFVTRVIVKITLNSDNPTLKCCQKTKRIDWISLSDAIAGKVDNLWGPEVWLWSKMVNDIEYEELVEYSLEDVYTYAPRDPPRNQEEQMLTSLNITERDIERVFTEFIDHCFPSFYMTFHSFVHFMTKYGYKKSSKRLTNLFTACNYLKTGFLSFHELLLGLVSIEPESFNGVSRIKFVFRYFDVDRDGYLNESEFRRMVKDIETRKDITTSDEIINNKVKEFQKLLNATEKGIPFEAFNTAVGAHKFRGTSTLCRSENSFFMTIRISGQIGSGKKRQKVDFEGLTVKKYNEICHNCSANEYQLSSQLLKLTEVSDGHYCDVSEVTETKDVSEKSSKPSEISMKAEFVAQFFIEKIRAFNEFKGTRAEPKGLMTEPNEMNDFFRRLELLCDAIIQIVVQEKRCLRIDSPTVVIGDIHGNLEDLLSIEKCLFRSAPVVSANYLFLGDYVDRGKWSTECAIYVLSLKLQAPNSFYLLRGNHEVRELQKMYTYYGECQTKYQSMGAKVWECLNRVFDRLPLAAVIDDSIFCSHGGIPTTAHTIEAINSVRVDLRDPEDSPVAWEVMWNDPMSDDIFSQMARAIQARPEVSNGFLPNKKRGTAYIFNSEAFSEFSKINGISHMIRAHEVPAPGFNFHFDLKCVTIFSCSHYCGNDNKSAVVHICDQQLTVIQMDTTNNAPATDGPGAGRRLFM